MKKKYVTLGHSIVLVQLERSNQGLGLSLAGHKDRNCMAVFVCGLNPNGAAYKAGGIQVGDEILEVSVNFSPISGKNRNQLRVISFKNIGLSGKGKNNFGSNLGINWVFFRFLKDSIDFNNWG